MHVPTTVIVAVVLMVPLSENFGSSPPPPYTVMAGIGPESDPISGPTSAILRPRSGPWVERIAVLEYLGLRNNYCSAPESSG